MFEAATTWAIGRRRVTREIRQQSLKESWIEVYGVLHYHGLPYLPEIIKTEIISRHHDDPLAGHFGIEKTWELLAQKYHWSTPQADIDAYVKRCEVCLASKIVKHKPYGDLQSLPVLTHLWKNLSRDFVLGLPVYTNRKGETYDSILIMIDWLTKIVNYVPVKVTIDAPGLAKVIIDVVVTHYD